MSHAKGPRTRLVVRLADDVVARLKAERDRRHLEGSLRAEDGLPAIVEEAMALRADRDREMETIRARILELERREAAKAAALVEARREARRWQRKALEAGARRQARAQARLPATGPVVAFLRDHVAGQHEAAALGAQPGSCPACGPPPA